MMIEDLLARAPLANYFTALSLSYLAFVSVVYMLARTWKERTKATRILMSSFASEALGWGLHQTWWFRWEYLDTHGQTEEAQWFIDNAWMLTGPYILIFTGYGLAFGLVARYYFGRWWTGFAIGVIGAIWIIGETL